GPFTAPQLGAARDQDQRAVGVRPDAARCRRRLDGFRVASQVIKRPALVREPGGGSWVARAKAQSSLERSESFLVAAVEGQHNAQVKMTKGEVLVQLDGAAGVAYCGLDVASPMARLGEHILGVRVFPIELQCPKGGVPSLMHERSEVLDGTVVPSHDQGTGEPEVSLDEVGVQRRSRLE